MDEATLGFLKQVFGSAVRHALTVGSGVLLTYGLVDETGATQLVNIGSGIVMGLVALGWSWYLKYQATPK